MNRLFALEPNSVFYVQRLKDQRSLFFQINQGVVLTAAN